MRLLLACVCLLAASCETKGRATADRISSETQLIGGPKALGQIGDYLLENDQIRVIVHGPGANRGSTVFGGSLIDADLQRPRDSAARGRDQLGEIFPAFLLEALEPTGFAVTRDGSDGGPASVAVDGVGGDLLQMVALLNTGLLYPPGLTFREEYSLAPGKRYVEITTTITNASDIVHPLPYLDPPDLASLGLDIPGLDTLQLSVPMGHLALFGAENHLFAAGPGFNVRFAISDQYPLAGGFPAFPGLVTDFLGTTGEGVSYGLVVPSDASTNYPTAWQSLYPGQPVTDHSMLLPYVYSSVTGVYHANPPEVLLPGQQFSFKVYFVVGRGDVGSVLDVAHEIRGTPTGTFAGRVLDERTLQPVEHASVLVQEAASGRWISQYETDERGFFKGSLPAGSYRHRIVTHVRDTTPATAFTIETGKTTNLRATLPAPATLSVEVRDETGRRVPAKVTLVGEFDAANMGRDPRDFLYDLAIGEKQRSTAFDPASREFIEKTWYTHDGSVQGQVRPGRYYLIASRGLEYELHVEEVVLRTGELVERAATVRRSLATPGWIGADLHLHAKPSLDSEISIEDRVTSLAGEGVEFAAATDHNILTDYAPAIASLQLEEWVTPCVGLELTTFEMGHFNGYPLKIDPGNVRGGDFKWAGEPPQSLFDQLRGLGKYSPEETIVQVNHPRDNVLGYFTQFNMDPDTARSVPREGLRGAFAPYRPEFASSNFSLDFDAMEIINGKRADITRSYRPPDPLPPGPLPSPAPTPGEIMLDQYGQVAFPGVVEDWFTLLNLGYRHTGIGSSDSHKGLTQEPGYPRTLLWVGESNDQGGRFDERDVVAAIRGHRGVMTNGPMIDFTVNGAPIGADVTDTDGSAAIAVRVRSAGWIPFERVRVHANGRTVLDEQVPVAQRHDYSTTLALALTTADTWAIVEVNGSANLFPVLAPQEFEPLSAQAVITALGSALDLSGLDPYGVLRPSRTFQTKPIAITNPIWIDHDGNGWNPPLVLAKPAHHHPKHPDLREAFANLPEAP